MKVSLISLKKKTFKRILNNETLEYINGILVSRYRTDTKYISSINKENIFTFNIITMDIETRENRKHNLTPVSISIFDGIKYLTFFITDYKNVDIMLTNALNSLLKKEYDGYHVYLHNLSKFDGVFLLKIISNISKNIKILIRDNDIISITINYDIYGEKYKLYFHDSLLLLPSSLEKLANNLKVEKRGSFDFNLLNKSYNNNKLKFIEKRITCL